MTVLESRAQIAEAAAPEPVERARVLLVDDEPDNLLSLSAVLDPLPADVVTAQSGREALRQLLERDFAVIVLDVMMPGMDGLETAALIRERERSRYTPIIFLTALGGSEEFMFRGYGAGAVDFLSKPFIPEVLRSKVGVFIELFNHKGALQRKNEELERAIEGQRAADQEVRKLNRHLEQRLEELSVVNRELEAFSYSVSHDLRGPLARIHGFSRALLDFHNESLDEEGRQYLSRISSAAERTIQLVDDLLNLARLTRAEMRSQPLDLSEIVRSIVTDLRARDEKRDIEFRVAPEARAYGDSNLLCVALLNLLENAHKFTGRKDHAVIEFGVNFDETQPVFYVRDNGAGFDTKAAQNLFAPFQRFHPSSDFEGTGIGLAIVERIIRRHGGRIWAEGEAGKGATFFFSLPGKGAL
jgi:signal transduction histidine kinase